MEYYQVSLTDLALTPGELAQVILDVERVELGISAGLQDRVVQSVGGLVHMDFSCFMPATHAADDTAQGATGASTAGASSGGLFPSLLSPMKFMTRGASVESNLDQSGHKNSSQEPVAPKSTPVAASVLSPSKGPKELVVNKDGTLSSASVASPGAPAVFASKLLASSSIPRIQTGVYTSLDPALLPPLYLAYNTVAGGDSGQVHSTVKERWAKRYDTLFLLE